MRKLGFIIGIIVLLMAVMPLSVPVSDSLPAQAAEPPVPVPTEPPGMPPPPPYQPPPVIDGHGTGALASTTGVVHISEQRMADGSMVGGAPVGAPPAAFDWRTQNKVTSVKNQGNCGSCYAHAALGNVESKVLIDTNTTTPGPDYSENNAKECDWRAINNWTDPFNYTWGSCYGGNYYMLASLFSHKGIVRETDDPYVAANTACNSSCPYNKTLLDWRIISGPWTVPDTTVMKNYIQANGPVYTTLYVGDSSDTTWRDEFAAYDGSYTLYYAGAWNHNHAVLIVGWNDTLPHAGPGSGGWIVKNSWGTGWGAAGYFTIAYGSAKIGQDSSFMYDWQDYDNNGSIMYYDDDYQNDYVGYGSTTGWGLCNFTPANNTYATRVEFWTVDATTDIDVYIYDDFNVATTSLSNLLVSQFNYSFNEPGYHGVPLSSPLALTAGDPIIVVVKFTDAAWGWPIPSDQYGPNETALTYTSPSGTNGSWYNVGFNMNEDVAIRLRTSDDVPSYTLTMAVNGSGTTTPAVGGHVYAVGTVVNITAKADKGWQFVNWTTANMSEIANATAASTTVTMDENKTVTANFVEQFTLVMAVTGNGTTDPVVGGHTYANGTVVPINATPDSGWHFVNWTTADMSEIANATAASTTVTVDKTKTVTANFLINQYNLTINSTIGGNVTIPGEGIFGPYNHGTVVNLTATPDANYTFINWTTANMSEIANPTAASTTVTVDENKTVTANFAEGTGATLVGNVTFPGARVGSLVEPFEVKLFEPGNFSNVIWSGSRTTNSSGMFNITGLTSDTYDIGIKSAICVSEVNYSVTLGPGTNVVDFTIRSGDVDDSDYVDMGDYSAFSTAFNTAPMDPKWDAGADLDRNDWIDMGDYSMFSSYFSELGHAYGYF